MARLFGRQGAPGGAAGPRPPEGLAAAADEVEHGGGRAMPIPTDVSDYRQVDAAAEAVERDSGPIDIWVNDAFTSVFAPFRQITPEEFKRVTEVTYLGFVFGTHAALRRMRPGPRSIVQVGSALGARAIPCSPPIAANTPSTDSLESLHRVDARWKQRSHHRGADAGGQHPSSFPGCCPGCRRTRTVPPIYQPEVCGPRSLYAANHPQRKQFWVGTSTVATLLEQQLAPPRCWIDTLDRVRVAADRRYLGLGHPANLWEPRDDRPGGDHRPWDLR